MQLVQKARLEITGAKKNAINPHLGSKYADLASIIEAVKPALLKHGISFIQMPEQPQDGEVRLTTRLMHTSGEWIEATIGVPMSKKDAQGCGSALTYARRYSLAAMTGLPQEDDDGIAASKQPKKSGSAPKIAFDRLEPELKAEVKAVADQVTDVMIATQDREADPEQAIDIIDRFCATYPDDDDIKPAIWACLDSKVRTAIRKFTDSQK